MPTTNWRFNPFRNAYNAETVSNEIHTVALDSDLNIYCVRLDKAPLKIAASFSVVEAITGGATWSEVSFGVDPNAGTYRVDYEEEDYYGTGLVEFNSADVGKSFYFSYQSSGNVLKSDTLCPVGSVVAWPLSTIPDGWLYCNGQTVSRTTYSALYAKIGTTYGVGDGSTTFTMPDYRGYFLRGMADGQTTDPDKASRTDRGDGTTGDSVGTKQSHALQYHAHTNDVHSHTMNETATPGTPGTARVGRFNDAGASGFSTNTTSITITGASNQSGHDAVQVSEESRPRNINVKWIMRA